MVEADYAQGQIHSTRAPVNSLWGTSSKTERMELESLRITNITALRSLLSLEAPSCCSYLFFSHKPYPLL